MKIDRPKKPRDLIGRTVWLHHQRGRSYFERIGPASVPLTVADVYPGIVVVRSLGEVAGQEHHVKASAISLLCPADQLVAEAERRQLTR